VNLSLPKDLGRLHSEIEITLFRALQEALTNVHRHSASPKADICLTLEPGQVRLEVQDHGQGMPPEHLRQLQEGAGKTGVGIAGMRERVRELGGNMTIESDSRGTLLKVALPLSESEQVAVDSLQTPTKISVA